MNKYIISARLKGESEIHYFTAKLPLFTTDISLAYECETEEAKKMVGMFSELEVYDVQIIKKAI